jgi:hypothetical protein
MPVVSRTSWLTWAVVLAIWLVTLAALAGPLFPFTPRPSDIADAVALTPDVDVYLREREAQHPDVKPEQAKAVIWSEPTARIRTPLALVYIHGFSASRRDITPAVETLASTLRANAFLTRLAAHGGASGTGFATVTAQDWLDDAREALAPRPQDRRARGSDRDLDWRAAGDDGGAGGQLAHRGAGAAVAELPHPRLAGEIHLGAARTPVRAHHHRPGVFLPARQSRPRRILDLALSGGRNCRADGPDELCAIDPPRQSQDSDSDHLYRQGCGGRHPRDPGPVRRNRGNAEADRRKRRATS